MTAPKVGFIGLGNMGFHMAYNLIKHGNHLIVHDINLDRVSQLQSLAQKAGSTVQRTQTPRELAALCNSVVTMLPSSPHVLKVYTDPETGILSSPNPSLLIDSSTIDPGTARKVAAEATRKGFRMVDAPVSGGVGGAEKGTLTFMVGGKVDDFEEARVLLKLMGKNIVHCGEGGTGQVAKIANNLVLAVSMIGVSEGMNLGVKLGIDPKVLAGIINTSSGRCWSSDTYNPCPGVMDNVPSSREYTGGFGTALMKKDLGLAVSAASDAQASIPMCALAHQIYTLMSESGASAKDFSYVYQFLRGDNQH